MADEELELELDVKEGGGSKKMIIMVVVGILLLNGIGVGAWMFLGGSDESTSSAKAAPEVELGPLKYLTLVPEFVVNFGPGSKVRYLQVDLQIATRQEDSLKVVSIYRPVIRNDVLVVLSSVNYEDLKDRAGKVALQKKILNAINKVVSAALHPAKADGEESNDHGESGDHDSEDVKGPIENVYFSSFIMQ